MIYGDINKRKGHESLPITPVKPFSRSSSYCRQEFGSDFLTYSWMYRPFKSINVKKANPDQDFGSTKGSVMRIYFKGPLILLCQMISVECPTNFECTLVSCHLKLI